MVEGQDSETRRNLIGHHVGQGAGVLLVNGDTR